MQFDLKRLAGPPSGFARFLVNSFEAVTGRTGISGLLAAVIVVVIIVAGGAIIYILVTSSGSVTTTYP